MQTALVSLACLLGVLAFERTCAVQDELPRRPNLVFIYTDDQGAWTVGAAGNPDAHTPNIDRIYKEGCHIPNAFVSTPVCSPARAALMTSRYPSELGIPDWIIPKSEDWLGLDPKLPTWPRLLQEAGYRTGLIGKWHLGRTLPEHHPTNHGYEYFMGHRAGGWAANDPTLEKDGKQQKFEGLTEDILTNEALAFIANHADEPFALSLHFRAPHTAWLPVGPEDADPHHATYPEFQLPQEGVPDLDEAHVQRDLRDYYSSITCVDRNVGRVLERLEELDLDDNTIVVFTSDHGYNVGQYGLWAKGNARKRYIPHGERVYPNIPPNVRPNLYDTSLRVPCAVRWPDSIEAGTTMQETVDQLDWFPTLCELLGVRIPNETKLHGSSFASLLHGGTNEDWDDTLYCEWDMRQGAYVHMRALRTPEWKYVIDFLNEDAEGHQRGELYDLAADPEERTNLFGRAKHAEAQARLHVQLCSRISFLGDHFAPEKETISVNFSSGVRYELVSPSERSDWPFNSKVGFWNNVSEPLGKGNLTVWRNLFDSRGRETSVSVSVEGGLWSSGYRRSEHRSSESRLATLSGYLKLEPEVTLRVTGIPDSLCQTGYAVSFQLPLRDPSVSIYRSGEMLVRADGEVLWALGPEAIKLSASEFTVTGSAIELASMQIVAQ